jgi:hypothetical protein
MKTSDRIRLVLATLVLIAAHYTAQAQTVAIIYEFGKNSGDPTNPSYEGTIAQGRDGSLNSTAPSGGSQSFGAIFQLSTGETLFVPYSFDADHWEQPARGFDIGSGREFLRHYTGRGHIAKVQGKTCSLTTAYMSRGSVFLKRFQR